MFLIESTQYNILVDLKKVMLMTEKVPNTNETRLMAFAYKDYKQRYPITLMTGTEEQCADAIKKIGSAYRQMPLGRCQI